MKLPNRGSTQIIPTKSQRNDSLSSAPRVYAGTLAAALLMFGTRWISYLGIGGFLFIGDILVASAIAHFTLTSLRRPALFGSVKPPLILIVPLGWSIFRLILAPTYSLISVRDFAPYGYIMVGVLSFISVRSDPQYRALRRTLRVIFIVLILHALWFGITVWVPAIPDSLPTISGPQLLHVFTPRPDIDSALVSVLAATVLAKVITAKFWRQVGLSLLLAGLVAEVVLSTTRAGLLSLVACLLVGCLVGLAGTSQRPARQVGALLSITALLAVGVFALSFTFVGEKFLAVFDMNTQGTSDAAIAGEGTARARADAWGILVPYVEETPARTIAGVGFGPDFMAESGALKALVNSSDGSATTPRSPHNYWLGTFARLGLIGLILVSIPALGYIVACWKCRHELSRAPNLLLIYLLPLAIIIPASFGVVLESPFGAIPFWWALGLVLAAAQAPRDTRYKLEHEVHASSPVEQLTRSALPAGQAKL